MIDFYEKHIDKKYLLENNNRMQNKIQNIRNKYLKV